MKTRSSSGFTLIEMLIAMFILSFIAMAVYNNTAQTYKIRDSVENEGDFYNAIRVTLDVMGRDISQIFTPKIAALPGDAGKTAKQQQQPGQGQTPQGTFGAVPGQQQQDLGPGWAHWGPPVNNFGVRPTRFVGEADKIQFITNSHLRLFQDSRESEFAIVSYSLEDTTNKASSRATTLVKRENTAVFEENPPEEANVTYPLVENVKSLVFKYLDGEKDRWENKWDSQSQDFKDRFPDVIEVTLEVFLPNSQNTFTVVQRFRPEMVHDL